ncbi:MAG: EI24 domain-containing protein [Gammaproteobacteria bacterium]|nr:EI24 domain-containing protein [Gammaproteobacteria bacterium]
MIADFRRAVADLLTPRFLLWSLLPLLVVAPVVVLAVASLTGGAVELWQSGGGETNWLADWVATWPWVGGVAEVGWVRGVLGLLGAVAGWLLAVLAALFLAVAVVGLVTPALVAEVRRRHYPDRPAGGGAGVAGYLLFLLRSLLVFMGLVLVVLPLLFVPGLNLLAINLPFYYWFHRLLTWDVLEAACPNDVRPRVAREARFGLVARTVPLYALSLVPLAGLFLQVFFVLVLAHHVLGRQPGAPVRAGG